MRELLLAAESAGGERAAAPVPPSLKRSEIKIRVQIGKQLDPNLFSKFTSWCANLGD